MSKIITWDKLPVSFLSHIRTQKRKAGNIGTKRARQYLDIITAFDIETSRVPGTEEAGMYIWQWQFGLDYTVMGRTWQELRDLIERIREVIPKDRTLLILVHNLSY